jgi:hypothetical protein
VYVVDLYPNAVQWRFSNGWPLDEGKTCDCVQ